MPASKGVPVVTWSSIELLHNLVRTFEHLNVNENLTPPVVRYRAKVKLHGTNCAIQVHPGGALHCQGRTTLLSPDQDNKGFATWVHASAAWFSALPEGSVLFGEWCGPGVEKGMAISALPRKVFAVFALQLGLGEDAAVLVDPEAIAALLPADPPADLHVLPWTALDLTVDFASRESLERAAAQLEREVAAIEAEDPWVFARFGVSGLGEGLVLYPVALDGAPPRSASEQARAMFKAKGEKHRTVATARAVTVDPASAASADAFAALVLTEARLEQALQVTCAGVRDKQKTSAFLAWLLADVRKECVAELEASQLTWPQVERPLTARARSWLLTPVSG